jgi:hypothetical protein
VASETNSLRGISMKLQFSDALNGLKAVAERANARANSAADIVARKCTELTGRQVNGPQLKSAAIKIGGIAMGFGAAMAIANIASTTVGPQVAGGPDGGEGGGPQPLPENDGESGLTRTGDFEGDVGMFFAENGVAVHEMTPWVTAEGDVSWE